jgi:glycosylphosphatidylinositol transamidase (GPIT) subunit GPI8
MTQCFAHQDVTFKVVVAAWSYIVWAPLLDKDNAINRVLAIIDSPWHSILESMTIAKIFSAVHQKLLERRKTRVLADRFLANTIQWILDDVRTVWQLVCGNTHSLYVPGLTSFEAGSQGLPCEAPREGE